jgi:hypothetical protein
MMGLHVISDGALEGRRSPVGGIGGGLGSYVVRAVSVLSFGRDLAALVRHSGLLPASRSRAARIRVPPMSEPWLRMHETDDDKHRAEF